MTKPTFEINFDGLVGPTHNYAGLAFGNVASLKHAKLTANPRAAALQGLAKMELLLNLGVKQAILPPHPRPNISLLKNLGFTGNLEKILKKAFEFDPQLLAAAYSAANMWTANAAIVSPSSDTRDHRVHFTPANLASHLHRAQESAFTSRVLKIIFKDSHYFRHHLPLLSTKALFDEGAANYTRLCKNHAYSGLVIFVYGCNGLSKEEVRPSHFPARQTFLASSTIARLHRLVKKNVVYAQQHPDAIDAGVFHNDVIAVGNENVFLFHERAYVDSEKIIAEIRKKFSGDLHLIKVKEIEIPLADAVQTYLFNSQLVTLADRSMVLIAPEECQKSKRIEDYLNHLIAADNPIRKVHYVNLLQSMQNGGGPACLRLRIVLTDEELQASKQSVYLTKELLIQLRAWVNQYYRDRLNPEDLLDPQLMNESQVALVELGQLLELEGIY